MAEELIKKLNRLPGECLKLGIDFNNHDDKRQMRFIINDIIGCIYDPSSVKKLASNSDLMRIAEESYDSFIIYKNVLSCNKEIRDHESQERIIPISFKNYYTEGIQDEVGNNVIYNPLAYVKWLEIYKNSAHLEEKT